jgi:hypothetical protein
MENDKSFDINPLVKELMAAGGQLFQIEGYIGPSNQDNVHFYKDLGLTQYLEISKKDIVRVLPLPEQADGRCKIFVRNTAEMRLVSSVALKAQDIISAVASIPVQTDPKTIERVYPPDNCGGRCQMDYITCIRSHGGDFWCAAAFTACVLGCIIFDGPVNEGISRE